MYKLYESKILDWVVHKKIYDSYDELLIDIPQNIKNKIIQLYDTLTVNIINELINKSNDIFLFNLNKMSQYNYSSYESGKYYLCIDSNDSNKFGIMMTHTEINNIYIFVHFIRNDITHDISSKFIIFGNETISELMCKLTDTYYHVSLFDNRNCNCIALSNNQIVIMSKHRDIYKYNAQLLCYDMTLNICWLIGLHNIIHKCDYDTISIHKLCKIIGDHTFVYGDKYINFTIEKQK
jgi:hypothetical protein